MAAGPASASAQQSRIPAAHAASGGRAAAKVGYQRACASARSGRASCLALIRTNIPHHLQPAAQPDQAPAGYGYGPADLQSAYSLPSSPAGSDETVAVVDAYNDPDAAADLATYRAAWGLPACGSGCFSVVNENGQASPLPADAAGTGWDLEESLDIDMVSAICPLCHIILVEASSTSIADLGTGVDSAVSLGAQFVSNSYATADSSSDTSQDIYYDHPGVAITASAGDDGYGVEYPASSQYVTAVGGTTLTPAANSRGWTESVWDGTGSGCSGYEPKPLWQADTGCGRRTVADVAADANPATGVAVYDSYTYGGWVEVGGTSVASPIIAATYALAGPPAPDSYPASYLYVSPADLFDVTSGSNGSCSPAYLCTGETGYDGPTGWGTPDGVAAFTPPPNNLQTGQVLQAGQILVSPGDQYTLTMQADGNLVVSGNGCVIWASGTSGSGNYLVMQSDGDLVMYTSSGTQIWDSGTAGTGSSNYLAMQSDGNLVVDTSSGAQVWAAGRANASQMCTNGVLRTNQYLESPSGQYRIFMQPDGNLVIYNGSRAIWASNTVGTGSNDYLQMQNDGNLVVYTDTIQPVWATNTVGTGSGNHLFMQDDGNFVVYTSAGRAVWASGT